MLNLALLFSPVCASNIGTLTKEESGRCYRLNYYLYVILTFLVVLIVLAIPTAKARLPTRHWEVAVAAGFAVLVVLVGRVMYVYGRRQKESQLLDVERLVQRGVSAKQAHQTSFLERGLRRDGLLDAIQLAAS